MQIIHNTAAKLTLTALLLTALACGQQSKTPGSAPAGSNHRAGETKVNPKDGLTYVWIAPGTFRMGCSFGDAECSANEKPTHQVTLSRGFWIGRTETTQAAYQKVTGTNPSHFKGENLPVDTVSWTDSLDYCNAVGMRLPTEAEWEFAARGGTATGRYGELDEVAWHDRNSGGSTHEVASKKANACGLFDMLGNVMEWTADWYSDYQTDNLSDPKGPATGKSRALRGGAWVRYDITDARASSRYGIGPEIRNGVIGVRCARN